MAITSKFGITLPAVTDKKRVTIETLGVSFQSLDDQTLSGEESLDLAESSLPPSPIAGRLLFYAKDDDRLYIKNSSGVETLVGSSDFNDEVALDLKEVASPDLVEFPASGSLAIYALSLFWPNPGPTPENVLYDRLYIKNSSDVETLVGCSDINGEVALDLNEVATPANPASGRLKVYAKSDDLLYSLNSDGIESAIGYPDPGDLPCADNGSISPDLTQWNNFILLLTSSLSSGTLFTNCLCYTYPLVYTTASGAYTGGILAPNGDIHFVPYSAIVGQKVSAAGVVSTYALVYTVGGAYIGGVLAPNGDIHFVPYSAAHGQKVSATGLVSTYALVYTASGAYMGGVLAPNGDIRFVPSNAIVGQKVSAAGVVSTYALVYTTANAYEGGVLAPNGDIHFVPYSAAHGQKVSATGLVSTYALVYTTANAYGGGVLAPNGDIHFVPYSAIVGQKVSATGLVSTYALVYTASGAYTGGVLASNGDIRFVPFSAAHGQKVSAAGLVSTYALVYTTANAYYGGVLAPNGDIHFVPFSSGVGQKIMTLSSFPFGLVTCCSPFLNKF